MNDQADSVLSFWFDGIGESHELPRAAMQRWFMKSDSLDNELRERFGALIDQGGTGALDDWLDDPEECLALVVLLDQFTRNVHRGSGRMYAYDEHALAAANHAIKQGYDFQVHPAKALFFYLPFEHSEALEDQETAITLIRALPRRVIGDFTASYEAFTEYAYSHRDIVARFGRFPHRNPLLGRESTPAEEVFLKLKGSSF